MSLIRTDRYVGNCYEHEKQAVPVIDAKGIETVRRDQCPAVMKMMHHSLRILFSTLDLSQVKKYIVDQLQKIQRGDVTMMDFVFWKEVKMGTYRFEMLNIFVRC